MAIKRLRDLPKELDFGGIVGVATITDCVSESTREINKDFDFFVGKEEKKAPVEILERNFLEEMEGIVVFENSERELSEDHKKDLMALDELRSRLCEEFEKKEEQLLTANSQIELLVQTQNRDSKELIDFGKTIRNQEQQLEAKELEYDTATEVIFRLSNQVGSLQAKLQQAKDGINDIEIYSDCNCDPHARLEDIKMKAREILEIINKEVA
ncbi:MAG: hypothetical protein ACK5N8_06620 [Alphaproteobacteria bacterium]